ncbi:carbamoyltransferase C-terminal domain-containing protein [Streptomyces sp. B21-105]|uniref:carbamoyltransferase family protein n=1 Tax=Streptomyces sp. B21-105 TaxID=3039417 RepID=UPI002FEF788F
MITLGITGSFSDLSGKFLPALPDWFYHDSAAGLVVDGTAVAAVEEERLNRIKHTNKFPHEAVRACLEIAGIRPGDIDNVAFFFGEEYSDLELGYQYLENPDELVRSARDLVEERLHECLPTGFSADRITFVPHHLSHAFGTFADSGFDSGLALVMDGNGEAESISVYRGASGKLDLLKTYDISRSLGHFYLSALPLIGFKRFDEYKAMGLAPYGDPEVYREEFARCTAVLPGGEFEMDGAALVERFLRKGYRPRRRGEVPRAEDAHLAAALQEVLERVVLHIARHWRDETGERRLCLAGGVAHNSSANGRLLSSGLFDDLFVHPASHDAGSALGAAQSLQSEAGVFHSKRLRHVFLGPNLGARLDVSAAVHRWAPFVEWEAVDPGDEHDLAARLIDEGAIVGWARGRSEFGPRALGHRSILADPRHAGNRDRVNAVVKKREEFRPFAPAVLAEHLETVFEAVPTRAPLDFMSYVVQVKDEWRERLPAVVHVDGSARVQTVDKDSNPAFWQLIQSFYKRSGVPVVLNTSFNNFAEPIVQTTDDALRCLVTTALDCLVLPGFVIRRRSDLVEAILTSVPSLHPAAELRKIVRPGKPGSSRTVATFHYAGAREIDVSPALWDLLATGTTSPADLGLSSAGDDGARVADELMRLWELRIVDLAPRGRTPA